MALVLRVFTIRAHATFGYSQSVRGIITSLATVPPSLGNTVALRWAANSVLLDRFRAQWGPPVLVAMLPPLRVAVAVRTVAPAAHPPRRVPQGRFAQPRL